MSLNRYDARRDSNEPEIVKALRACGAKVRQQDFPDLLVKSRRGIFLLEVENPENKYRRRSEKQQEFLRAWEVPIVKSPFEALLAVGEKVEL